MAYELSYKVHREFLEVILTVHIEPGKELHEAMERWKRVAELCRDLDRTRILAIMRFTGSYAIENKFQLAKGAPALGWSAELKLAVVIADEVQFIEQSFTEMAMNSLGYEMKLFQKKRPAKNWLLG